MAVGTVRMLDRTKCQALTITKSTHSPVSNYNSEDKMLHNARLTNLLSVGSTTYIKCIRGVFKGSMGGEGVVAGSSEL